MSVPKTWRGEKYRYRLEAVKCTGCGKTYMPARAVCPECGSRDFEDIKLPAEGKIVTYSMVHVGPAQMQFEVPYAVAIIELENGLRLTTQIVDTQNKELKIGQKVRMVFRKIQEDGKTGVIGYGYKAMLAE
ncbi:Zn-ribbon domain-containing OB-fold protein [bacterium]|nr:Zn-ribbon domain-containing OB-fold protein [bacterium]